jgi:tetratricopeptide (TPR) repeat protein
MSEVPEVEDWVLEKIDEYKQMPRPTLEERDRLIESVSAHATFCYRVGEHKEALEHFARQLALIEKDKPTFGELDADRASLLFNLGACLHFLGEFELARKYLGAARQFFDSEKHGRLYKLAFGNVNANRVKYIDERVALLEIGEKPDTQKYLDGSGNRCAWKEEPKRPEPIMEPKEREPVVTYPAWTYFSAREWRAWYRGEALPSAVATMPGDQPAKGHEV